MHAESPLIHNMKSFKTINTYDLSEDDKSQMTMRTNQRAQSKPEAAKIQNQALEVNIDEESDEDEDISLSHHNASPRSRYGWKNQVKDQNPSKEKPLTKLSRKPNKIIKNPSQEEERKELTDTIEVSDFESSANSFGAYSLSKNESFKNNESAKAIEQKLRRNNNNETQPSFDLLKKNKNEVLEYVTGDWVSDEIQN